MNDSPVHNAARQVIDEMLRIACKPNVGLVTKYVTSGRKVYRVRMKVERVKEERDEQCTRRRD